MDRLLNDLRFSLRSLRKQPGFTAVVVLTLALGLGVNISMFQTLYGLLARPLPLIEGEGLMALGMRHDTLSVEAFDFSPPDVEDLAEQCQSCESVASYDGRTVVLASGDEARRIRGQAVSPGLFDLLGVPPALGRSFRPDEDQPGSAAVVLLSEGLWRRLGADETLVGQDLRLDGHPAQVIGVMPAGFRFPEVSDVWFPLEQRTDAERSNRWIDNVVVRLAPGAELSQAQAEIDAIASRLARDYPLSNQGWSFTLMPYRERLVDRDTRRVLSLLAGAVAFVFLIACVNVTNLLLAREQGRRATAAIRLALGSDRWSLIRQRMTENLVLAMLGAALGLLVSPWIVDFLAHADPAGMPSWMQLELGGEGLAFTLGMTLVSAFIFGLVPAWRASRPELGRTLGAARPGSGGGRQRLQRWLVVAQIALALTHLVGAGMVVKSVRSLLLLDAGFETEDLLTMRVQLADPRYDDEATRIAHFERIEAELTALPDVVSAAATSAIPLLEDGTAVPYEHPGQVLRDGERQLATYILQTPGLFDVLDVPMLSGRRFTDEEIRDPERRVIIVSDSLARQVWGDRDPVGERLRLGYGDDANWSTVVGVVPKIYYEEPGEETDQSRFQIHLPYARVPWRTMAILVRTQSSPEAAIAAVGRQLEAVDPTMAVDQVFPLEAVRRQALWGERLQSDLFAGFALLALVLAALGVYGVMAHGVAQRRGEIGVRMALGADRQTISALFLGRGALLIATGCGLGLFGALTVSRLLASLLYGVGPTDPWAFGGGLALLALAAGLGVFVPARRASRVEPVVALRQS